MPARNTVVAIVYDFDGTLAEGNIQENSFIPKLEMNHDDFWDKADKMTERHNMDKILAYMYLLISEAQHSNVKTDRNSIKKHGASVNLFEGVEDYFDRINSYAKTKKIALKHYIVSSGIKEMIEGTPIAKEFENIFASSFKYDQNDVVEWPALAVNYTTKTQYLFRINKGIENAWDNSKINEFIPENDRPIPFKHMIYLGDGETDIPAMKIVKHHGGHSIAVYQKSKRGAKQDAMKLLCEDRANYVALANYSAGLEIDTIIKSIIDRISAEASVKKYSKKYSK